MDGFPSRSVSKILWDCQDVQIAKTVSYVIIASDVLVQNLNRVDLEKIVIMFLDT